MLFAGYQTNPNYLGICWAFLQRHAAFLQIGGAIEAEAAAQEGEARPPYLNRSHCYALTNELITTLPSQPSVAYRTSDTLASADDDFRVTLLRK